MVQEETQEYLEEAKLKELVEKYSEFINFPIYLYASKEVDVPADEAADAEADESEVSDEDEEVADDEDVEDGESSVRALSVQSQSLCSCTVSGRSGHCCHLSFAKSLAGF